MSGSYERCHLLCLCDLRRRFDANPENVERGLAKLVLTLIELLR